jgi:hypothetical protein
MKTSVQIRRNVNVENTVNSIVSQLDKLISGEAVSSIVPQEIRTIFNAAMQNAKGSVRLANLFFIAYAQIDEGWNFEEIPVGIRGTHGDKKLASALTNRHVHFHMSVTAFGENLGWKGNVRSFNLSSDGRFSVFMTKLQNLNRLQKEQLLQHAIWEVYQTRAVPKVLPKLPSNYLSYSRSLALCEELIALQTEGHVQQFLVAAFLTVHRGRFGNSVKTHHPHAADKFDNTCGDIEEFRDEELVAAYEVTVRDDWKNRLPDFQAKMIKGKLSKYVIIASNIHSDIQLSSAKKLLEYTKDLGFDLAIVDIRDFFCVFCAELSKDEISSAINNAFEFLIRQDLCGRIEIQNKFSTVINSWMEVGPDMTNIII